MPSRRHVLASVAAATTLPAGAGCLSPSWPRVECGVLSVKVVQVGWDCDGQRVVADCCSLSDEGATITGWVAEEYADVVGSSRDVRVDHALARRLGDDFASVEYLLGICRRGAPCERWFASRRDFNRVQFGDRATVVRRFPRVHVVDVAPGIDGPSGRSLDVRSGRFQARFSDRCPPPTSYPADGGAASERARG